MYAYSLYIHVLFMVALGNWFFNGSVEHVKLVMKVSFDAYNQVWSFRIILLLLV